MKALAGEILLLLANIVGHFSGWLQRKAKAWDQLAIYNINPPDSFDQWLLSQSLTKKMWLRFCVNMGWKQWLFGYKLECLYDKMERCAQKYIREGRAK